jgi:FkbM family methyltransferase
MTVRWTIAKKIRKAGNLYRDEGLRVLTERGVRYVRILLTDAYRRAQGSYELTVDGVTATFDTRAAELGTFGFFEEEERYLCERLLYELDPDDVFYDVGAHIGLYTCLAGKRLPDGDLVAFEPSPPNARALRRNLSHNGIDATVIERALLDREGEAPFDAPSQSTNEIASIATEVSAEAIEVRTDTADRLVEAEGLPQPNVVKIDVEGAEERVVDGMTSCLRDDRCRFVLCEVHREGAVHGAYATSPVDARERFESLGFEVEHVDPGGFESYLVCRK